MSNISASTSDELRTSMPANLHAELSSASGHDAASGANDDVRSAHARCKQQQKQRLHVWTRLRTFLFMEMCEKKPESLNAKPSFTIQDFSKRFFYE